MNTTEKSKIERLTDDDFNQVSRILGCELVVLQAVQQVETDGRGGFFVLGKSVILYEGHIFQSRLKKREAADAYASLDMFQIMSFNYAACAEASVESFVQDMCESEYK